MLKHLYKVMGLVIIFAAALWFFGKYIEEINVYTPGNTVEAKGDLSCIVYQFVRQGYEQAVRIQQ